MGQAPCLWMLVCRIFYASSACVYPEFRQTDTKVEGGGLKESDAWPAQVGGNPFARSKLQIGQASWKLSRCSVRCLIVELRSAN
jgi:nucleoside-diphosphate-sugar epimerase